MTVILHALLLDIPEKLETERLVLRATRAWIRSADTRQGIATEATLADSCLYAQVL